MKQKKLMLLINLGISILLTILLAECLMHKFGLYLEAEGDAKTVSFYVDSNKNSKSYGHEARIVNIRINGKNVDMADCQNAEWIWHEEWGYILYQGEGNSTLSIECETEIDELQVEYVRDPGAGVLTIAVGDTVALNRDLYRKVWKNYNVTYRLSSVVQTVAFCLEILLVMFTALSLAEIAFTWAHRKDVPADKAIIGFNTFDFAKGIGMMIIIGGHSAELVQPGIFGGALGFSSLLLFCVGLLFNYSLMSMFFTISGYGYRKAEIRLTAGKQLKYWSVPYSIVALGVTIVSGLRVLFESGFTFNDFLFRVLPFVTISAHTGDIAGISVNNIGPMWFGTSLCFAWILLNIIENCSNKIIKAALYVAVLIAGSLISRHDINFFCIPQIVIAILLLKVGVLVKKYKIFTCETYKTRAIYIAGIGIMVVLGVVNGLGVSFATAQWGNWYPITVLIAAIGGIVVARFFISLNKKLTGKFKRIKKIGFNSFYIFYIHTFEYLAIPWEKVSELVPGDFWGKWAVVTMLRVAVIYLIYGVVNRIKTIKWNK